MVSGSDDRLGPEVKLSHCMASCKVKSGWHGYSIRVKRTLRRVQTGMGQIEEGQAREKAVMDQMEDGWIDR